jgi:hypothetical protein
MLIVTPGKGISVQARTVTGGPSGQVMGESGAAPEWLRIERVGGTFSMSASEDGTTWRNLARRTVGMASTLLVGLPVSSHSSTALATAVFSDLSVVP